jgi:eukaryotic-like serine/threonine-protein kinase
MATLPPSAADTLPDGMQRPVDPVGRVIADRYRLIEHLSEGGMASVYLAEHVAVGRKLALKILHPEQAVQPDVVRRFLQEARAASMVRNPHVVDIIDVGFTNDGLAYMAMELLDGEDLATLLQRAGPLPWARLGPMILQICDALHATHALGIVHRDIKPENCFVTEWNGAQDYMKIIDFGIAKDLAGNLQVDRPRTVSGSIFGTAPYVAPELLAGKTADHRVDIYALGIVMYELLLGKRPFAGEALSDILLGHLQTPPAPLRSKIPDRVSEAVDALILRALAKDPDLRFQSMTELGEAVASTLDPADLQRSIEAGAVPTGSYLAVVRREASRAHVRVKPAPRRSTWFAAAALLTVASAALVVLEVRHATAIPPGVEPPFLAPPYALAQVVAPPRAPKHVAPPAPPLSDLPAEPTPDAAPPPAAPRPVRLQLAAVRKEIDRRIAPKARDCLARHTRLIKGQQFPVRVEILPSGEARSTATLATSPAARCIADVFKRHRFAANLGGLTLDHAFTP